MKKHNGSTYDPNHFRYLRGDPTGRWSPIYEPEKVYKLALVDYGIIAAACLLLAWMILGG